MMAFRSRIAGETKDDVVHQLGEPENTIIVIS